MKAGLLCGLAVALLALLVAAGEAKAGEEAASAPPPRPSTAPGLAARYPGDLGIDTDPAVIFAEGFEGGQIPTVRDGQVGGFFDLKGVPKEMYITSAEAAVGGHSLELLHTRGVISPQWFHHTFPGQDTVYVRFYRKFATDWVWPPLGMHDTILFAGKYQSPASTDLSLYLDIGAINQHWARRKTLEDVVLNKEPVLVLKASFQGPGLDFGPDWLSTKSLANKEVVSHVGWDNYYPLPLNVKPAPVLQGGTWYCWEYMGKMNSGPNVKDGEVRLWIDGVLVTEEKGLILRDPQHMGIKWDRWMLGPRYGGPGYKTGPPQDQKSWIDGIVAATRYIGPAAPKP
jgi:hypothetical protein